MVLHLEIGSCASGVDVQAVDNLAKACYKSDKYLNDDGYKCPTCLNDFRFMSGLLQHAESDSCSVNLKKRKGSLATFLRFLKARVIRE
jgi:hypothetical protein